MFKIKTKEQFANGMMFQSFKRAVDWEKVIEVAIITILFFGVLIVATSY